MLSPVNLSTLIHAPTNTHINFYTIHIVDCMNLIFICLFCTRLNDFSLFFVWCKVNKIGTCLEIALTFVKFSVSCMLEHQNDNVSPTNRNLMVSPQF